MKKIIMIEPYLSNYETDIVEKLNKLPLNQNFDISKREDKNELISLIRKLIMCGDFFEIDEANFKIRKVEEHDNIREIEIKKGTIIPYSIDGKAFYDPFPKCTRVYRGKKLIEIR